MVVDVMGFEEVEEEKHNKSSDFWFYEPAGGGCIWF